MEYADSRDSSSWTPCEDTQTAIEPGTWYVRYKDSDTIKESHATEVVVQNNEPALDNGVYQIADSNNLLWFADFVNDTSVPLSQNANAVLIADIDMAGITWPGISSYSGTFNGSGFAIKNLNSANTGERAKGFVDVLEAGGVIQNLKFDTVNVFIQASNRSAVIAGENDGFISGCTVEKAVVQCGNYNGLAGIVALNNGSGTVENCSVLNSNFVRRYGMTTRTIGAVVDANNGIVKNCISYGCTFGNLETAERGGIVTSGKAPTNSYFYTAATTTSTVDGTAKTAKQFASGVVAYLLNGGKTDGTQSWYQTVTDDETSDHYPSHSGAPVVFGDANDDGVCDLKDLVRMKKKLAGQTVPIKLGFVDADANGNLDSTDLTLLRKVLLGVLTYNDFFVQSMSM